MVEANPNPYLSEGEDMAWAAEEGGYPYPELLEAIIGWAARRAPNRPLKTRGSESSKANETKASGEKTSADKSGDKPGADKAADKPSGDKG